jgi:hypothetical protein
MHRATPEISALLTLNRWRMHQFSDLAPVFGTPQMTDAMHYHVAYTNEERFQLFLDLFRYSTVRATRSIDSIDKLTGSKEAEAKKSLYLLHGQK